MSHVWVVLRWPLRRGVVAPGRSHSHRSTHTQKARLGLGPRQP
jgi:hypothetical protein